MMKKILLPLATALLFSVAAFAQTNSQGTPSSTSSSPAMQEPGEMGHSGTMANSEHMKSHKIKGCVEQENGQYILKTERGKVIPLTGEDVAAHDGHTVILTGTWAGKDNMSGASSTGMGETSFDVTNVRMVSHSCKMESKSGMTSGATQQPK